MSLQFEAPASFHLKSRPVGACVNHFPENTDFVNQMMHKGNVNILHVCHFEKHKHTVVFSF